MIAALGVVAAGLGPALFWLWFIWRRDRYEREPKLLLAVTFALGAVVAIPAGLLEGVFGAGEGRTAGIAGTVVSTMFLVGPIEETAKFAVVRLWAYPRRAFNEIMDGPVYAAAAAAGFAGLENIGYIIDNGAAVMLIRAPVSTLAHLLFAMPYGLALGRAKMGVGRPWAVLMALVVASALHGLFDLFLMAPGTGSAWGALIVLVVPLMVVMWRRMTAALGEGQRESPFRPRPAQCPRCGRSGAVALLFNYCAYCGSPMAGIGAQLTPALAGAGAAVAPVPVTVASTLPPPDQPPVPAGGSSPPPASSTPDAPDPAGNAAPEAEPAPTQPAIPDPAGPPPGPMDVKCDWCGRTNRVDLGSDPLPICAFCASRLPVPAGLSLQAARAPASRPTPGPMAVKCTWCGRENQVDLDVDRMPICAYCASRLPVEPPDTAIPRAEAPTIPPQSVVHPGAHVEPAREVPPPPVPVVAADGPGSGGPAQPPEGPAHSVSKQLVKCAWCGRECPVGVDGAAPVYCPYCGSRFRRSEPEVAGALGPAATGQHTSVVCWRCHRGNVVEPGDGAPTFCAWCGARMSALQAEGGPMPTPQTSLPAGVAAGEYVGTGWAPGPTPAADASAYSGGAQAAEPAPIQYAGFPGRLVAWVIDQVVLGVVLVVCVFALAIVFVATSSTGGEELSDSASLTLGLLVVFGSPVLVAAYHVFTTAWLGGTFGKRVLGYRVVTTDLRRVGVARATGRCLAQLVSVLGLGLGYLWIGVDSRKQGWHDRIADTLVVRDR